MNIRIVSDSASNLYELEGAYYVSIPMKIIAGDATYVDDSNLNVRKMMDDLKAFRGKSNTAHPRISDWDKAFGDADVVFGVTVTSKLSGSYNSAVVAAENYMEKNPGKEVFILDSRSTGPQMELILEKYVSLIKAGKTFKEIKAEIQRYRRKTHIWWSLESLQSFVNTGRISGAAAFIIKLFGVSIVGKANEDGELEPTDKIRGSAKYCQKIYEHMLEDGYSGGKVRIRHSYNEEAANIMAKIIRDDYPDSDIKIDLNKGLCGYYVEKGGILVAFEG